MPPFFGSGRILRRIRLCLLNAVHKRTGLNSRLQAELREDTRHVYAHRFLSDEEPTGDLAVCPSFCQFGEYGPLSRCQRR
jgi:hypothetical protein